MTTLVERRMGLLTDAKPPHIGHFEYPPGHATDRLRTSLMHDTCKAPFHAATKMRHYAGLL